MHRRFSGVLTEPMGKELKYGEFSCYLTSNDSLKTNETQEDCKAFKNEDE